MNAILKGNFLFNFENNEISAEEKKEAIKQIFKIIGTEKEFIEKEYLGYQGKKTVAEAKVVFDVSEYETMEEALKSMLEESEGKNENLPGTDFDLTFLGNFIVDEGENKRIMKDAVISFETGSGKLIPEIISYGTKHEYNRTNCIRFGIDYFDEEMFETEDVSNYKPSYIFKRKLEGAETSFSNETEWIITGNVLNNLGIETNNKTSSQVLEIVRAVYKKGKFSDMEEFEEEVMNNIEKEDIEI